MYQISTFSFSWNGRSYRKFEIAILINEFDFKVIGITSQLVMGLRTALPSNIQQERQSQSFLAFLELLRDLSISLTVLTLDSLFAALK